MSLHYTPILDLRVKRITALNFSPEGSKLVAITSDGFLYVWDLPSGNQYRPTPGPITKNQSCCTWMNETSFLCGFQDGYVLVGTLNADCTLTICRTQWANHPLSMLSFHKSTGLLAGGGADGVKIWKQSRDGDSMDGWAFVADLPRDHHTITYFEWLSPNELLVSYLDNGFAVWKVDNMEVICSFKPKYGHQICTGVICANVQKFVALNGSGMLDIYDVHTGEVWSPPYPQNISVVNTVHRGSSVLAAGVGLPELVDIANTRVCEILPKDPGPTETVHPTIAIATYQDKNEEMYMIATALSDKIVVWKADGHA